VGEIGAPEGEGEEMEEWRIGGEEKAERRMRGN
jgi:hypothetical protein